MTEQNDADVFIASLTVAEIRRGVLEKPAGRRREQLDAWFSGPEGPQSLFAGRILAFHENAALKPVNSLALLELAYVQRQNDIR